MKAFCVCLCFLIDQWAKASPDRYRWFWFRKDCVVVRIRDGAWFLEKSIIIEKITMSDAPERFAHYVATGMIERLAEAAR